MNGRARHSVPFILARVPLTPIQVACAVDCGQVVNPETVEAQMQGAVVFGATAALYGQITIDKGRVQQSNFHNYRMMRINETPEIEVQIVPSTDTPGGIGVPPIIAAWRMRPRSPGGSECAVCPSKRRNQHSPLRG